MLDLAIIGGQVVDDKGHPVRNALVGAAGGRDQGVARTNARGRFALGLVAPEPVRVMARKPGFVLEMRGGVAPWTMDLRLTLRRSGSLSGRVVADPAPKRYRVRLLRWEGARAVPAMAGCVLRRPGGSFSVTRLPAGIYEVRIEAEGYRSEPEAFAVDVAPGDEISGLEARLSLSGPA